MIQYAVVIPTNRSFEAIQPLLFSLCQQTIQPSQIVIVYDKKVASRKGKEKDIQYSENIKKYLSDLHFIWQVDIVDELSTSAFVPCQGASYVRNFGRSKVVFPYMMFVDDDNRLDSDACEKLFGYWLEERFLPSQEWHNCTSSSRAAKQVLLGYRRGSKNNWERFLPEYTLSLAEQEWQATEGWKTIQELCWRQSKWKKWEILKQVHSLRETLQYDSKKASIVVPLQSHKDSKILIPCLAQSFNYLLCRPKWLPQGFLKSYLDRYCPLSFASSNCLVGPTDLFVQFPFDESIPFVYEDMILTGMMSQAWVEIVVDTAVTIHHDHAQRSKLAQMYIDTPQRAYYKAKHRIILVQRLGSLSDKLLFYLFGLWWHTLWLIGHILYYAKMREWMVLTRAIVRGTRDGCSVILR